MFEPIRDVTLSELLRRYAQQRGDAEALVYPAFSLDGHEVRLTARQLDTRVDELARGLVALGIDQGDHVALWAPNVPDWVPLEFALARVGAVLVTVNTALSRDEVAYVLEQSRAVAVLHTTHCGTNEASASLDALLEAGAPAVAGLRRRVWLPSTPGETPPASEARLRPLPLDELVAAGASVDDATLRAREDACSQDDVCNIQYTSGTTGFPKGVMLSHRNLVANAYDVGIVLRYAPGERVTLVVPLFHCYGCAAGVLGTYAHGGVLCCLPGFDPGATLRLIAEERTSVMHGVPTMYGAMVGHPDRPSHDLSTLRVGTMAGAPCPEPLLRAVEALGPVMTVAYGLTETSPAISLSPPEADRRSRTTTVGPPLPGVDVRIVDPATGEDAATGEAGELWARGYNVMVGYHDDPEATARTITPEGWLRTGDLATLGDDGCLRIVGRIKDIIIRGGENITPAGIEAILREHEDVVDAAVVGVPDAHFGEEVAAALVLREGARFDPQAYTALLEGRVAPFRVPKTWHRFDAFPLTGSGKVRKFELREAIEAQLREG